MRLRHLIPALLILCIAAGGTLTVHAAGDRQRSFAQSAAELRALWGRDQGLGVPAASLDPLRARLDAAEPGAAWWSPGWLRDDGRALLDTLAAQTRTAWTDAMEGRRSQAQAVIGQWAGFFAQDGALLSATSASTAAGWTTQLDAAASPAAITTLASSWSAFLAQQRAAAAAAAAAQQAHLAASQLQTVANVQGVLTSARRLVRQAASANLDSTAVVSLADQLSREVAGNDGAASATRAQLVAAVAALQGLVALNNQVGSQVLPLLWDVDQAEAEGAPTAAALRAAQSAISVEFRAARTAAQLNAVAAAITSLHSQVGAQLAAGQCGHAVGSGKVITISLSLQEMVFYQDGCVVRATPVSTGRPQLRTPTGMFSIFYKKTPFTFISPWPRGSPFYYYPSPVSWVMEFAAGGYFIHDAPWEPMGDYGPGSEDNLAAASHGCVHTPAAVMQWAFSWTPTGTPVVISA